MRKKNGNYAKEMLKFIDASPTAYQAAENLAEILKAAGATELSEKQKWTLDPGRTYFVRRNDSALIAFRIPGESNCSMPCLERPEREGFRVFACHGDSPSFKIKENPEQGVRGSYVTLNTEAYGGMIRSTWLDRPLSVAGRVLVKKEDGVASLLVDLKQPMLLIPNLAIHMDRSVNDGKAFALNVDMVPLYASGQPCGSFLEEVANAAGIQKEEILGHDLYLYNAEKGVIWGRNGEFLSSSRLDDLECVFAGVSGFTAAEESRRIAVFAMLDNEEVGSGTRQGAASTFLKDTLQRISMGLGDTNEEYLIRIADSFLLSADNGHALHPNHPEKNDPTNTPVLNGGLLLKFSANQKYTTDGFSAAFVKDLCSRAGVPCQFFFNRSDIPGGSTLGNISVSQVAIPSADIGLTELAMHSAYETAGTEDVAALVKVAKEFFE